MKPLPPASPAPVVGGLSDTRKARLKAAGLDPADPELAIKLQAKFSNSGAQFRNAHMSSVRILHKQPRLPKTRTMSSSAPSGPAVPALGANQSAASASARLAKSNTGNRVAEMIAGLAFVGLYSDSGTPLQALDEYGYGYNSFALVSFADDGFLGYPDPNYSWDHSGTVQITGPCGINFTAPHAWAIGGDKVSYVNGPYSMNLTNMPDSGGKSYMYVEVAYPGFDLGATPLKLTVSVRIASSLTASFSKLAHPQPATAIVDLTIDAAPPFIASNSFGIGNSNGLFANPGATRLDPGTNPNASTSGDDVVGLGVNLGAGWSVTSAKVIAVHSVLDAPNDTTPDDSYRGAVVTQPPSSGRLQTGVHWHYGTAESLSYTIEWQLQGPGGQRPLLTMPLGGSCDS